MVSVWKAFSVPVSSSLFLTFSSIMFIASGLCWGLWYIWNWVLCKMIKMDLFPFHYMQLFILTNTICWRCSLCSNVYLWLLYKKKLGVHTCVSLCLGLQFHLSMKGNRNICSHWTISTGLECIFLFLFTFKVLLISLTCVIFMLYILVNTRMEFGIFFQEVMRNM